MAYSAKILADSMSPDGVRLTTLEVTFPRIVLAEFNTHRVFSRNSASSRAIPVEKMLKKVKEDPFIPIYWGKNQKGMQAEQELTEEEQVFAEEAWLLARDKAVDSACHLLSLGIHKQITNRILEPWLWHTVIVTSTEWENWRGLRRNKDAQPEIRCIADMIDEVIEASTPQSLSYNAWHLPLIDDWFELQAAGFNLEQIIKICVGRCTRVSYLTHDGKRDPQADIELCERLLKSGHMSPFEHAARPMSRKDVEKIISSIPGVCGIDFLDLNAAEVFSGNFRGWIQSRKHIKHEDNFQLVQGADRTFDVT